MVLFEHPCEIYQESKQQENLQFADKYGVATSYPQVDLAEKTSLNSRIPYTCGYLLGITVPALSNRSRPSRKDEMREREISRNLRFDSLGLSIFWHQRILRQRIMQCFQHFKISTHFPTRPTSVYQS